MNHLHNVQRPELTFEKMDATNMEYDNEAFSVVIDKGTLDAMMPDESPEVVANVNKLFSEIERVLRLGGRYICISLLQPHILNHIVEWFVDHGWPLRILRCNDVDASKSPEDRIFPVFAIIGQVAIKVNFLNYFEKFGDILSILVQFGYIISVAHEQRVLFSILA